MIEIKYSGRVIANIMQIVLLCMFYGGGISLLYCGVKAMDESSLHGITGIVLGVVMVLLATGLALEKLGIIDFVDIG